MKRKHSLTLLEVIISMILLGTLLMGLLNCFHQGVKKNFAAKELKERMLCLELFQQKLKLFFASQEGVWIEKHPDALGSILMLIFEQKADPDPQMCGHSQGMLYLNSHQELCFVTWGEKGSARMETLLDKVGSFQCELFDVKKGKWMELWSLKKKEVPQMVSITLEWGGSKIPFMFFLNSENEEIVYPGCS